MADGRLEALVIGPDRAGLDALEASLPGRARAAVETAYVLAVLLAPTLLGTGARAWTAAGVLAAAGAALVWRTHALPARIALALGAVALVLASFTTRPRSLLEHKPRIGVSIENTDGAARVTKIADGSPAAGHLRVGDRITAIDERPLERGDPANDVTRRAGDPHDLTGARTRFRIIRDGAVQSVDLALPPPTAHTSGRTFFFALGVRDLCLLGLALLLVVSDGQHLRQIGLRRDRLGRELAFGLLVLAGTYAVHIAASLPLAVFAAAIGAGKSEVSARTGFLGDLVGWAQEVRLWEIPIYMCVAATFEEVVFRGFFITRMRSVLGRWAPALVLATVLFGLGHLEEGHIAAVQTAILGLWFGAVFIRRKRLESVIVAHAAFDTIMFAVMIFVLRSGLLEKARALLGH